MRDWIVMAIATVKLGAILVVVAIVLAVRLMWKS